MSAATVYTVEYFLYLAAEEEARYQRLLALHPPGTFHEERNDAQRRMEDALECASWMQQQGYAELRNVGPFMLDDFRKGDRVRIRKGAAIHSTYPATPRHGVIAATTFTAKVHSFGRGHIDLCQEPRRLRQGLVHWAGQGRYRRWTEVNNVEAATTPTRLPTAVPASAAPL